MSCERHLVPKSVHIHCMGTQDNFQGHYKTQCELCKVIILSVRQKTSFASSLSLLAAYCVCVRESVREVEILEKNVKLVVCIYAHVNVCVYACGKLSICGYHQERRGEFSLLLLYSNCMLCVCGLHTHKLP